MFTCPYLYANFEQGIVGPYFITKFSFKFEEYQLVSFYLGFFLNAIINAPPSHQKLKCALILHVFMHYMDTDAIYQFTLQ